VKRGKNKKGKQQWEMMTFWPIGGENSEIQTPLFFHANNGASVLTQ
jgi:hypothetical protein